MAEVMFRCQKTGQEFDSGFRANRSDVKGLPDNSTIRLRCGVCGELHEFKFSDARINDERKA
jgi:hypothetical protein